MYYIGQGICGTLYKLVGVRKSTKLLLNLVWLFVGFSSLFCNFLAISADLNDVNVSLVQIYSMFFFNVNPRTIY